MIGKRVEIPNGPHQLREGEYGYWIDAGAWYAYCPGPWDLVANLGSHDVVEHEDRTITVSPSILCSDGKNSWHGYLEHGIWRQV